MSEFVDINQGVVSEQDLFGGFSRQQARDIGGVCLDAATFTMIVKPYLDGASEFRVATGAGLGVTETHRRLASAATDIAAFKPDDEGTSLDLVLEA